MWDVDTIYKVPRMLHEQGLDGLICDKLRLNTPPANLRRWDDLVYETEHPQTEVNIAMVGKYVDLSDSYKSLNEALRHAGMKNHAKVVIEYVDSETITPDNVSRLARFDGILVPGGFGVRGVEGKICAARFAREQQDALPRHLPGHAGCHHRVRAPRRGPERRQQHRVRPRHPAPGDRADHRMERRRRHHQDARCQVRPGRHHAPGRAKLGRRPGTLAHKIYGDVVTERHRHRYEANVNYLDALRASGLVISALTQREQLTEIVELPQDVHPWFVGVQFHPEFKSTPWDGHPLFNAYIAAVLQHRATRARTANPQPNP
jgi:CTP synthase